MIFSVAGIVTHIKEQAVVIEAAGIGYLVAVPTTAKFHTNQKVHLITHMHWNQEQGPTLYGFEHESERTVFTLITSCSGIGPRLALAILAHLGSQGFLETVSCGDERSLSKVSGIGPKKAEQMIVALKHKVSQLISSGICCTDDGTSKTWQEVSQALESLNYTRTEISQTMQFLTAKHAGSGLSFDQLLRQALGFLSKRVQ